MILVTVGTQDKAFTRLLEAVEQCIVDGIIQEEVIVQAGYTKYVSDKMTIVDYFSQEEYENNLKECRFLITHGGVGTIMTALKNRKPMIVFPRLTQFKEHTNNHQLEIAESFKELGYILVCSDSKELANVIKEVNHFVPNEVVSNTVNFINLIKKSIDELL